MFAQVQQDPSAEITALRSTILSLWEKRVAEGNRKLACVVLDSVRFLRFDYAVPRSSYMLLSHI